MISTVCEITVCCSRVCALSSETNAGFCIGLLCVFSLQREIHCCLLAIPVSVKEMLTRQKEMPLNDKRDVTAYAADAVCCSAKTPSEDNEEEDSSSVQIQKSTG